MDIDTAGKDEYVYGIEQKFLLKSKEVHLWPKGSALSLLLGVNGEIISTASIAGVLRCQRR